MKIAVNCMNIAKCQFCLKMLVLRLLKKFLASCHATKPRSITADGDKAYPVAIRELKKEKCIPHGVLLQSLKKHKPVYKMQL
ncbi:hypothetical protein BK708_25395 [Bacillus thuringiensis serovar yunnanensis]|nr:hypothetical protein BK708_25395 [Bacillus thuringiensis serovar yunnanensis]